MNSMIAFQLQEEILSPVMLPTLTNEEAAERFSSIAGARAALHSQIEHCTDPLSEKCLLTLLIEAEVEYLETLYAWEYEPSPAVSLH